MFDESEVKAILQRAIELDTARSGRLTRDDLVQVATEVGVSREAIEQAITERAQIAPAPLTAPDRPRAPMSMLRLLNIGTATGFVAGLLSNSAFHLGMGGIAIGSSVVGTLCFGGMLMVSGGLSLSDPGKRLSRYFEQNIGIWLGFASGGVLATGYLVKFGSLSSHPEWVLNASVVMSLTGFVLTTVVGPVLLAVRRASSRRLDDVGSSSQSQGGSGPQQPLIARAVSRAGRWLGRVLKSIRLYRSSVAGRATVQLNRTSAF